MSTIADLAQAVERLHSCKARHVETVPVVETFRGQTVWQGIVEVFALSGHPKAQCAYAWSHWEDDKGKHERIVTVLGAPPVDSPVAAVRAAIVADVKRNRGN